MDSQKHYHSSPPIAVASPPVLGGVSDAETTKFIVGCSIIALVWAAWQFGILTGTKIDMPHTGDEEKTSLSQSHTTIRQLRLLKEVHNAISTGAEAFLRAEYGYCAAFIFVFAIVIYSLISWGQTPTLGALTTLAFVMGALTSILSGYIGMKVAVYANARTTIECQQGVGFQRGFNTAFRAGAVMGFCLPGFGLLVLYLSLLAYRAHFVQDEWTVLMECISGYGLGGSSVALFGRVGGGIYTKAADVGADLVGKVVHGIPEDDPRNPATIADNVGDNVGDVAGMGADLFGSFAESTCAALVIATQCDDLRNAGWGAICFPMTITSVGILVSLLTSFVATHIYPVTTQARIELALRLQLIISTVLMIPCTIVVAEKFLPAKFHMVGVSKTLDATSKDAAICVICGTVSGLLIGITAEYYTSNSFQPVKDLVNACRTGAATNIIYGLALGYLSCIPPAYILAACIYVSFELCDLYGVALAAVGMLGNLSTCLTIDCYGPVCDNAGGIAEMAELAPEVRQKTDALDAAGNTTAAVGKGFAIASAAAVSLALYGAFVVRIRFASGGLISQVEILHPLTFAFLLVGANLPFWFSAMTMKSVGEAAMEMVYEVERQFKEQPDLLLPNTHLRPDYDRCVAISTRSALREMIAPGALVLLSPLIAGTFFGVNAVFGLLTGSLLSGVQLAISMSNTGGAWDNAKKYIEGGHDPSLGGKGSDIHKAAVVGDTVGDPLKDTSGPALNILMKLMAIISLVFADYFYAINHGKGLFGAPIA